MENLIEIGTIGHNLSEYCLAVCFDVDGGSSSSHGQTDTETAVGASSHGQTALAAAPAIVDSICSDIDFEPSLLFFFSIHDVFDCDAKEKAKFQLKICAT